MLTMMNRHACRRVSRGHRAAKCGAGWLTKMCNIQRTRQRRQSRHLTSSCNRSFHNVVRLHSHCNEYRWPCQRHHPTRGDIATDEICTRRCNSMPTPVASNKRTVNLDIWRTSQTILSVLYRSNVNNRCFGVRLSYRYSTRDVVFSMM